MTAVEVVLLCILSIPVFAVSARLALPPTVDAIVRIHEVFVQITPAQEVETRVVLLEEEIRRLRMTVHSLSAHDGPVLDAFERVASRTG